MNIEDFRDYCLSKKGISEGFPFDENVLVFKVMGKMIAYGSLAPKDGCIQMSMKCNPERSVSLRERYDGIRQGAHTCSLLWNSVCLDSDVPDSLIRELLDHSLDEVLKKMTRKLRAEYEALDK